MSTDEELLAAWAGADLVAGERLFERHYEALARFFHNKVEEAASLDLVQATFLACIEGRARFRRDASFRTYLFGIAHNLLRAHYRKRREQPATDLEDACAADLGATASEVVGVREEQRLLLAALRHIPIDCQEALELHYWEEMTTAAIGEITGVPEGTVKARLQRGRRLLQIEIQRRASSRDLLRSTLDDLDQWAAGLRARLTRAPAP